VRQNLEFLRCATLAADAHGSFMAFALNVQAAVALGAKNQFNAANYQ
jgi:hypothetical protein